MKKIIRLLTSAMLVFCLAVGITAAVPDTAYAASVFVQKYSDMIGQGGYIYYIKTSEKDGSAAIWRMKVSNGKRSRIVSEPRGIISLTVSGQRLYYTAVNDDLQWEIRSCSLSGDDLQAECEGRACYVNSENIYFLKYGKTDVLASLYAKSLETGETRLIKTEKKDQVMDYVCNIGSESYYYVYDRKTDKLYLYRLHTANHKMIRVAAEKRVAEGVSGLMVSDVRQMNGELYYDFGSYEGTGNFWNGTIRKLTVDGKKKTVAKYVENDQIMAGSRELYFSTPQGSYYKYNLKTGKKAKYSLKYEKNISYEILGDKTYMADTSSKKKIVISRFNSGTDRETLTKNFISIPFKQKANINYSVSMKQVGIYNMICVTGTDFTDMSYGWRGKLVSINWYVTDGAGTVLASFQ